MSIDEDTRGSERPSKIWKNKVREEMRALHILEGARGLIHD